MTDESVHADSAPDIARLLGELLRLEPVGLVWHGLHELLAEDDSALTKNLLRHAAALKAALRLTKELSDRGIPHLFLKGPTLQRLLYGETAIRPYSDLDVWVDPSRMAGAVEAAIAAG